MTAHPAIPLTFRDRIGILDSTIRPRRIEHARASESIADRSGTEARGRRYMKNGRRQRSVCRHSKAEPDVSAHA